MSKTIAHPSSNSSPEGLWPPQDTECNVPRQSPYLRQALPVIRQPFGEVQPATIPLQTSPYLKIFILRSHPEYNVPRRDKIAKALPVIRQPPAGMQSGTTCSLARFSTEVVISCGATLIHNVPHRSYLAEALSVIRRPSAGKKPD